MGGWDICGDLFRWFDVELKFYVVGKVGFGIFDSYVIWYFVG